MDHGIEELNLETLESRLEMESLALLSASQSILPIECSCYNN